jgi:hypothetical protein
MSEDCQFLADFYKIWLAGCEICDCCLWSVTVRSLIECSFWCALFVNFSCIFLKFRGCAFYKGASYSAKITVIYTTLKIKMTQMIRCQVLSWYLPPHTHTPGLTPRRSFLRLQLSGIDWRLVFQWRDSTLQTILCLARSNHPTPTVCVVCVGDEHTREKNGK